MSLIQGARQLAPQHLSIRVPWHDSGWNGCACARPRENSSCLVLPRIAESRDDDLEVAGCRFDEPAAEHVACRAERSFFMAPFDVSRKLSHPYAKFNNPLYAHFAPTPFRHPKHSAACVPFRWMNKKEVEGEGGLADRLRLDYQPEREPKLTFDTPWVQERRNQLVLLDTFFSAVRPEDSLCFFYAKRTPLTEDPRRVIVAVGRVKSVGAPVEYEYAPGIKKDALRCVLWERNVVHTIRPDFKDGFVVPYAEVLAVAEQDESMRLEDFVAFAPEAHWDEYSYGSAHVTHDGAIASLLACATALRRCAEVVSGPWTEALAWIDAQLNGLWKMRGAFPGIGSCLTALGVKNGNLLAHAISLAQSDPKLAGHDAWAIFEGALAKPSLLGEAGKSLGKDVRELWAGLKTKRRDLLVLLSRFALTDAQATRFFEPAHREKAEIALSDDDILRNPYALYEEDRPQLDAIRLETIDRGLLPAADVARAHPVPAPSSLEGPLDRRRVRGFVIDTLERAAGAGHTVQPRSWVIRALAERDVEPRCAAGQDLLDVLEAGFAPMVERVEVDGGEPAYQVARLSEARRIIANAIRKRQGRARHSAKYDWRKRIDAALGACGPNDEAENRARQEKAAALEELFASGLTVLVGSAGTGKTTLLNVLCGMPEIEDGGVLLLAPTGKARVRMQQLTKTGEHDFDAFTIAQFLLRSQRYVPTTGTYQPNPEAERYSDYGTVILDECSMLTEEQLAATLDALSGVKRFILVGDPRQLPPIGSGRPFVDIVRELEPEGVESLFPRRGLGYAELTITRRMKGANRGDLALASWFTGRAPEVGADEIWAALAKGEALSGIRTIEWNSGEELETKLLSELVVELKLKSRDDELGFALSIGGSEFHGNAYFSAKKLDDRERAGAASRAEGWEILSPVRSGAPGVESLNRLIQLRFRKSAVEWAEKGYRIPKPFGPQGVVYGDKVISVVNGERRSCWPTRDEAPYIANGDLGIVVGQYKPAAAKWKKPPWKLQVEFTTEAGIGVEYFRSEFGDEGSPPLELAYALTVHKAQGSEFGTTFLVLPNPCRLLSRELLYTALTRQQHKLVLLHQGPLRDLRRFAGEFHSAVAGRMTNLLRAPKPVEVKAQNHSRFFEDRLVHRTQRGDLVRSKSEIAIADALHARGVRYQYEASFTGLDGTERYPDFTIHDDDSGITWLWEHLGMLGDPTYRARWEAKKRWYRESGVRPWNANDAGDVRLVETSDAANGGLDMQAIGRLIDTAFAGLSD